jgi:phosphatidylcholine synthase
MAGAWFTHLYTAAGAVLALLALVAIVDDDIRAAFLWLAAATFVDSTDGLLARIFRVKERLPHVDGARLDDIVDYLTFVFVPAFLLLRTASLPPTWGLAVTVAMLLSSGIAFVRSDAKTHDHFFTGFPSYWNIVAFYLIALQTSALFNAVFLLVLCALVYVRIGYVYPSRTPTLRALTLGLGYAWAALVAYLMWRYPALDRTLLLGSLAYPVYYVVLSLALHGQRREAEGGRA